MITIIVSPECEMDDEAIYAEMVELMEYLENNTRYKSKKKYFKL